MTSSEIIYSDYDRFAWFYNRYWGGEFSRPVTFVLGKLLLPHLPERGRVLDLCCGTGQLAAGLLKLGFRVTGIDGSAEMLGYARANAPGAEIIRADARGFDLPAVYHAAVSTFDSLNHVMNLTELVQVFRNVHRALRADGIFLFDLNMEEEFQEGRNDSLEIVERDHVCIVRNPPAKVKRYEITMFRLEGGHWRRSDLALLQKYYSEGEVQWALAQAGFGEVMTYDADREFGLSISDGRCFFLANKGQAG
jgi:SAM-dependent methyltransferase